MISSIITRSGSYIPTRKIPNSYFLNHEFFDANGKKLTKPNAEIIKKFEEITCIKERRFATDDLCTSDVAYLAAKAALGDMDREQLDYIIVGHNYGDVAAGSTRVDFLPTIAARVKQKLKIKNPYCVAYDLPFGCPGWLQGVIFADQHIKTEGAQKVLVIGAELLSRISDPHDIDCMIYADGGGATLVEAGDTDAGVLASVTRSDTLTGADIIFNVGSYNPEYKGNDLFLKMNGHDVYRYALRTVPKVVKKSLDKAGLELSQVKKVLLHQANEKMDQAILKQLFKLCKIDTIPEHLMPMTISWLGNSSVATLPTLYDLLQRGELQNHKLHSGDIAVFASVGAGMNINSMVYRMP